MRDIKNDAEAYASGKSLTDIQKDAQQILAMVKAGKITEKDMIAFAKLYGITLTQTEATEVVKMAKSTNFKNMTESELKKLVEKAASDKTIMGAINSFFGGKTDNTAKTTATSTVKQAATSAAKTESTDAKPAATATAKPTAAATTKPAAAATAKPTAATTAKPAAGASSVKPAASEYYTVTASTLNVRSGAGAANKVIGGIDKGTTIEVTAVKDNWGKISYHGQPGWIFLDYAKKTTAPTGGKYTVTASVLNVRKTPDTVSSPIGSLKNGSSVQILEVKNKWGRISFNGKDGWIFMDYVKKA